MVMGKLTNKDVEHVAKLANLTLTSEEIEKYTGQLSDVIEHFTPTELNSLDHTTCLMDPSRRLVFVTVLNPEKRLLLGYLFKPQEYPWTQNWEYYPPDKKLARGLEFSTQPFDVPRREVVQLNSMFGAPVYRWLPARTKIESRFLMFYTHTPEGMRQVDDVRLDNGKIIIEDRKANKQVTLSASLPI